VTFLQHCRYRHDLGGWTFAIPGRSEARADRTALVASFVAPPDGKVVGLLVVARERCQQRRNHSRLGRDEAPRYRRRPAFRFRHGRTAGAKRSWIYEPTSGGRIFATRFAKPRGWASRLGVSLCSGWDAGGPWVEREDAMKALVCGRRPRWMARKPWTKMLSSRSLIGNPPTLGTRPEQKPRLVSRHPLYSLRAPITAGVWNMQDTVNLSAATEQGPVEMAGAGR